MRLAFKMQLMLVQKPTNTKEAEKFESMLPFSSGSYSPFVFMLGSLECSPFRSLLIIEGMTLDMHPI